MAMNEILCQPLPFTVAASSGMTNPENMGNDRLGRVATFGSNAYTVIDLGSSQSIDLFGTLASNSASSTRNWRVRGFNSVADAQSLANTVGGSDTGEFSSWASSEAGKRVHRNAYKRLNAPVSARYWRIDGGSLTRTLGRLVIGKAYVAADTMDIGYTTRIVDHGENPRGRGAIDNPTIFGKVLEFSWTWSWMTEAEARGALLDILAYAGKTRPILCILNPDAPDLHNVIGYGMLEELPDLVNIAGGSGVTNAYEANFRLQSRLILNL